MTNGNGFVEFFALEYWRVVSNRVFLVTVDADAVSGAKVRGQLSATAADVRKAREKGDAAQLADPVKLAEARQLQVASDAYLAADKANFTVQRTDA